MNNTKKYRIGERLQLAHEDVTELVEQEQTKATLMLNLNHNQAVALKELLTGIVGNRPGIFEISKEYCRVELGHTPQEMYAMLDADDLVNQL